MTDPQNPVPPAPVTGPPAPNDPPPAEPYPAAAVTVARLTDGQWHRLHPATPLLKGGFALIVILGYVLANLRERFVALFLPQFGGGGSGQGDDGDPLNYIVNHGIIVQALLALVVVLAVVIGGFYISWRMHTFRITDQVVEVRSGILFRVNRKARLDRIQGINIVRPFFSRLFGAAKLEISQAGHDANVQLSYLASAATDDLRREILRRASGSREATVPDSGSGGPSAGSVLDRRLNELLAPELDATSLARESVVKIHLGRLLGSIFLGTGTLVLVLIAIAITIWIMVTGRLFVLLIAFPSLIGFFGYYARRFSQSLRYTIAGTPDGVRVGFGLFSTSNETLPPGRIHSIEVSQPVLWRAAGWWQIKVNRASHTSSRGAANQANTTILPVGSKDDVNRVVKLMLPDLIGPYAVAFIDSGMTSRGDDNFTNSPRRAFWLRPLSYRRNGFAAVPGAFLIRKGAIWRRLIIVPQPRLQSVALHQGPLLRWLRLASVHLHTVHGPIAAELGAIDADDALAFFTEVAEVAVRTGQSDTSHRWRSGEGA